MTRRCPTGLALIVILLTGCSSNGARSTDAGLGADAGGSFLTFDPREAVDALRSGPSPTHEAELFHQVLEHLTKPANLPVDGDWPEDFGDANYFGPVFFQRYATASGVGEQRLLAQQSSYHNELLVRRSVEDPLELIARPADTLMGALGLAEVIRGEPSARRAALLQETLDAVDGLAAAANDYPVLGTLPQGIPTSIYGPTTLNGALALMHLEASEALVPAADEADHLQRAAAVLQNGRIGGYASSLGYYRMGPEDDALYLYPNVMQMLAHARAYQLTQESMYRERAEALYEAIQPLKVADEGRYRSPYGSSADDFTSLSSQNYLMLALLVLHETTGKAVYRQEVLDILEFLRDHLLVDGRVLHHWMDGAPPQPQHSVHYCSGCNLQLLYVIWRLHQGA
jgi:hypothetical protein